MDDREIVSAVRACLAQRIGKDRYEVWFGATTELSVHGETLAVSVPTQFFQDWLRCHFRKDLEAACLQVVEKPLALEFRIAETDARPSSPPKRAGARPARPTADCGAAASNDDGAKPARHAAGEPHGNELPATTAQRVGFVGKVGGRPLASLDTFVVGGSNCLAHKAAQMAAEQPGTYSPLVVHGPTGTGKTHLLEGVCSAFRKAHPRARTVYLSAEQFTGQFMEALRGSGMPSFRRKYRDLDLLAIDDLQFFKDKRATVGELQHTIDTLARGGKQVVLAADRPPSALKSLGPELVARLSGGMVARLEPADYEARCGIVRQFATRLDVSIPRDVEAYIATHFTTQSRELAGAVKRLKAMSLAHGRPITLALAEEALSELIDHQGRVVKLADIERAVCDVCGLGPDSLQSRCKGTAVSHPRMLAMWLARKHTRAPLNEIGSYFGRRSHSTVISAHKKIESWMSGRTRAKLNGSSLSVEETIRRVEEQLRVG